MLPFTHIVRALPVTVPFVPPEALEREQGQPLALRVGANESNFGISPRARQAMVEAVEQVHWYNDPEGYELRSALAVRQVEEGRREYAVLAAELGLQTVPSATNFVALDVGSGERARRLMQMLLQHGVFVRMPGVAPLARCIRVTVGPSAERQAFAKVLCAVSPQLDIGDEIFC